MTYIDYCNKIYNLLSETDFSSLELKPNFGFQSLISAISKDFSWSEMKRLYRNEIDSVLDNELFFFKKDLEMLRQIKELNYYEESISSYTAIYFFWVWNNKVNISKNDQSKLVKAIFVGTIGYKLIDIHSDNNFIGQEAVFLGSRMIRLAEELYSEVFGSDNYKILNKYFTKYCEVEYLEKRNRWKNSPFSWENPKILGYKAAPLFSIFEVLFHFHKMKKEKINDLIEGLVESSAAIQLMDDFVDSGEDILNGFETLVMKGFFEKYGIKNKEIPKELLVEFYTEERLSKLYNTAQELFENARILFNKHNDEILLLFLELQNFRLNSHFESV